MESSNSDSTSASEVNRNNITSSNRRWWHSITFTIYLSHTLTSWGDRMWGFAVGLYLIILFPESLQYTAIFGFTTCVSVIIGGPFIGKWVDRTSRLKAAKCALVTQNLAVMCCAILLILFIRFDREDSRSNKILDCTFLVFIIVFAVTGELASVASKIALEKDWIVVLARGNERKLSKMNATMRTIDLTTSILAPAVVAQIIAFVSQTAGAGFIATWNLVSGAVEIYLLHRIYKLMPELSLKKATSQQSCKNNAKTNANAPNIFIEGSSPTHQDFRTPTPSPYSQSASDGKVFLIGNNNNHMKMEELIPTPTGQSGLPARDFAEVSLRTPSPQPRFSNTGLTGLFKSPDSYVFGSSIQQLVVKETEGEKAGWCEQIRTRVYDSMIGWKRYYQHPVRNAGVGLALLYMTVLGFDTITIGYMYSQGVSESLIGILTAVGAVFGILGSISFPSLRRILGKSTVGVFGFGFETSCLVLCVVSIFMPGSPFVPDALWGSFEDNSLNGSISQHFSGDNNQTLSNGGSLISSSTEIPSEHPSHASVIMFTLGILLSRYGLWIADLSVTQFFQEEVHESQRGILNGVQDALNQFMSLIKFILVIIFPTSLTFGYLIALSFLFVFMGWVSFIIFTVSWRRRKNKIQCTQGSAATCAT